MGKKNKLEKFADLLQFPNVVESYDMKSDFLTTRLGEERKFNGVWREEFFHNDAPICLELACGKGDYTLGLSDLYPQNNYLGIDIKGNRIWKGAKRALEGNKINVGFLRTRIERLSTYFDPGEVSEIWITFPDPFPKKINRRLTSEMFLNIYKSVLAKGALVHLKTDSQDLFDFSLEEIERNKDFKLISVIKDIYDETEIKDELRIQTFYEISHLEDKRTISYLCAQLEEG